MNGADFDLQPVLRGELLELRPLRAEDFDALFSAASDPLIWDQHPESDRYTLAVFGRYFDGAMESKGAFAIIDRASGRVVGSSRYANLDADRSEVEIGWTFLVRACWGGAYNSELKRLMLDHAFRFVKRVIFNIGEKNIRSQKAIMKIGGRQVRTRPRAMPDGTMTHDPVFAIDREEWLARPEADDATE